MPEADPKVVGWVGVINHLVYGHPAIANPLKRQANWFNLFSCWLLGMVGWLSQCWHNQKTFNVNPPYFTPPLTGIFSHNNGVAPIIYGDYWFLPPLLELIFEISDFWDSLAICPRRNSCREGAWPLPQHVHSGTAQGRSLQPTSALLKRGWLESLVKASYAS